jgi:flagellar hook-associated protein 1 FlgK
MRREEFNGEDGYQYSRVEVYFAGTGNEFKPKQGELRALMDIRDVDIPRYEQYIDDIAKTLVTEVNKIHQSGYTLEGLSFMDFFDSDPNKLNAANIDISQTVKDDIKNIAAGIGGKISSEYQVDMQLNLDLSNPNRPVLRLQEIDEHYRHICKGTLVIEGGGPPPTTLTEGLDYYVDYQTAEIIFQDPAGDFASNPLLLTFEYNENGFGGPGDGDNALLISQLRDKAVMQSDPCGKSTQTINQFYAGALGRLGVERNEAASGLDTRTNALQQLKLRQKEVMEVDPNEELANMILYEHVYQASARFFTTVNSMFDTLLNM